ncbi:VOC family protein [Kordiimonas pumila]|uniref:VOC family protein n=1 Tax=Kordiimonas pumila TaxID=2161677 RepID=A0ABV7D491_9PROT|nr:VOC family protein [Kordiimonas pumila]
MIEDINIKPIREFDHLMCGVKDVEAVEDAFKMLGFTMGPVTPLEGVGVVNRRILLTPKHKNIANYIEFMQLGGASGDIPSYLKKWLGASVRGDEGIHSFIMRTDDARAAFTHFEKRHQADPSGGFSPVLLEQDFVQNGPDGMPYRVNFSNCIMPDLEPPLYISTSQIKTLDFYMDSVWRTHPNGACSWLSTIAVSKTPLETAKGMQAVWGGDIHLDDEGMVAVGPSEMRLKIFTPERFEHTYGVPVKTGADRQEVLPYAAGVHISVNNIDETLDFLLKRQIKPVLREHYVIIPPEYAHGILLCFEQEKTNAAGE